MYTVQCTHPLGRVRALCLSSAHELVSGESILESHFPCSLRRVESFQLHHRRPSLSERAVSGVSRAFSEHFPSRSERRASQAVLRSTLFDQAVRCARDTPRWIFLMYSHWVAEVWLPEYPLASFGHYLLSFGAPI